MFQLTPAPAPAWIIVGDGIRFHVRYGPTEALNAARRGSRLANLDVTQTDPEFAFVLGAAIWAVTAWEGLGDADGETAPLTRENLALLLSQRPDVYDAFADQYVDPLMGLLAEKKGSAPSPNGTSVTGPASAKPARRTARSAPTA
jgi:hypothetical protein